MTIPAATVSNPLEAAEAGLGTMPRRVIYLTGVGERVAVFESRDAALGALS